MVTAMAMTPLGKASAAQAPVSIPVCRVQEKYKGIKVESIKVLW